MASALTWYKDNSHVVTATVTGSGTGATVTGTLLDAAGVTVWTGSLSSAGSDTYTATIDPGSASVTTGRKYTMRIAATYSGRSLEFEDVVVVQDRSGA